MCFSPSIPKDNSAQLAAQQEADRQSRIKQGQSNIDAAFDGTTSGINPASDFAPGTVYYTADGTPYTAPSQDDYNKAFPSTTAETTNPYQAGTKQYKEWQAPPAAPATNNPSFGDWQLQQEQAAGKGGKLFTGTQTTGGFNPEYYDKITKNYEDYYNPQLDQQYQLARDKLTEQLGQQGILQSTEGNRQLALAKQSYDQQKQAIADQGANAANTARQQVAQSKNNLYQLNTSAADPSLAASQAASAAASAVSPVTFSPLANVFAGLIGQGTNALALQSGQGITSPGAGSFLPVSSNTAALNSGGSSKSGTVVP